MIYIDSLQRLAKAAILVFLASGLAIAGAQEAGSGRGSLRSTLLPKADIKVSSSSEGIVKRWLVEEGQTVREGDVLLELESKVEALRIEQAEASMSGYRAQMERAEKSLARVRALSEANIQSDRELESAEFEAANAKSQFRQASASRELAQAEYDKKSVRSPVGGIFLKRYKQPGEAIARFETAARVLDVSSLEMVVYASAEYWGRFEVGDSAPIEITSGPSSGRRTVGQIASIDPVIDPVAGTFRVRISVEPTGATAMGLYARLLVE